MGKLGTELDILYVMFVLIAHWLEISMFSLVNIIAR